MTAAGKTLADAPGDARPYGTDAVLLGIAVVAVSTSGPIIAATAAPALAIAFWRNALASGLLLPVLLATCRERRVAVQTIKALALRPWSGRPRTRSTWYEPLQDQDDIDLAVWWALGRPEVFLDSVGDVDLLPRVLSAAARFRQPPAEPAMQELMRRRPPEPLFV